MTAANEFRWFIPIPSVLLQIDFLCQILQLPFPANKLVLRYIIMPLLLSFKQGENTIRIDMSYMSKMLLLFPLRSITLLNYREMLS